MEPLATLRNELPDWTLAVAKLDGVMGYTDTATRTIWVDVRQSSREMRSTIMHEVIHALHGHDHDDPDTEQAVQVEASRRLIPVHALGAAFRSSTHPEDVCDILDVDLDTLHSRMRSLDRNEWSLIRRLLCAVMPNDSTQRNLCGVGRWWTAYDQPGDPPCIDGCRTSHTTPQRRSTLDQRKDLRWPTSSLGEPLAARVTASGM